MEERFSGPITFNAIHFHRNGRRGKLTLVSRRIIFTSASRAISPRWSRPSEATNPLYLLAFRPHRLRWIVAHRTTVAEAASIVPIRGNSLRTIG